MGQGRSGDGQSLSRLTQTLGTGQGRSASEPSHPDPGDRSGEVSVLADSPRPWGQVRGGQRLSRLTQTLGTGQGRSASEPSHPDPGDGSGEVSI